MMTIDRFLNRKELTIDDLYRALRVELLHELVFWRDGNRVIEQASESDYPLLVKETQLLARMGKMTDDLHRTLKSRLRVVKQHLSWRSPGDLMQMIKSKVVQDRMWTFHLEDRLMSLIATKKNIPYVRKIVGIPSVQLMELMAPSVEIEIQGGEEEPCDVELVQVVSEEELERQAFQVEPTLEMLAEEAAFVKKIAAGQVKRKERETDHVFINYLLSPDYTIEQVAQMCYSLSQTILSRDLEDNLPMRILMMVMSRSTFEEMNEELKRIYLIGQKLGRVPCSLDRSPVMLYLRYLRGDHENGMVVKPGCVRRKSIELLDYDESLDLTVAFDKRINMDMFQQSMWEMKYCMKVWGVRLGFQDFDKPLRLIYYEIERQIIYVTNNPIMSSFRFSPYIVPYARDISQFVLEARKTTWGPNPIMVFSLNNGMMVTELDPEKEFYIAYHGNGVLPLIRLTSGLPGFRKVVSKASSIPMAILFGPQAAFRREDPALGLLDSSWMLYRFPPLNKMEVEGTMALWIIVSSFDLFYASCRPLVFKSQTNRAGIPVGQTELVAVAKGGHSLIFIAKGWSKQCLFQVKRFPEEKVKNIFYASKMERVLIPFDHIGDLGIAWQSRMEVEY